MDVDDEERRDGAVRDRSDGRVHHDVVVPPVKQKQCRCHSNTVSI